MKRQILRTAALLFCAASVTMGFAQTAEDHIAKGDEYYAQFDDAKALEEYLLAVQVDPANYGALWRASRAYIDVGDVVDVKEKGGADKQKKMYIDSEAYARKAVQANPDDTWGHFYLSAAMGKHALLLGKKEQVSMSKEIKTEIEKAIELDGTNDYAYHALGRWHRRMAEIGGMKRLVGGLLYGGIPKGTFQDSAKFLRKAVELKPDYINHHLELARTYVSLERNMLAAQEYQACLDLPITSSKCHIYKKEAETELANLKK